ncbi:VanZ family protein [Rhodoferax ferrireducens]|uniref:VanZ family protein n=1 Tax=Rhodoferax ferrireducens TaxID=192843 RepID=A0ABU2CCH2_9BURK|nr:VanZ family protein [Rhodoferax ferrireducens]MDR7379009.1 VanZ family protein [Rhodoferax ferrireducens]
MHKTSAWPLALLYAGLVVYASLYPFDGWRDQGIEPWFFITAPWPKYWTGFDVATNLAGYAPLGFLLALSGLRSGRTRVPVLAATLAAGLLSLCMETLQSYLPVRVPSNVDWALNTAGGLLGAVIAALLERLGAIDRWSQFRARWFVADARGVLVLLALWPVALLFPAAVPLGLGQVMERVEAGLAEALADTPFLDWLPVRDVELQPLVPGTEMLCVLLGALIPCLLGYCVVRRKYQRVLLAGVMLAAGLGAAALSAGLSYGPQHALDWLSLPVRVGLWAALPLVLLLVWVPRRVCAALLLVALALHLGLLNQAPASAYFAQTLQTWEQGRFIRFHGLVQWLGWLWPYAALAVVVGRTARPTPEN